MSSSNTPKMNRTELPGLALTQLPSPGWENRLVILDFPPNASVPVHTHPIDGILYVISGSVTSHYEGHEEKTYGAGETLFDFKDTKHLKVVNPSSTERAKVLVSYVVKKGEPTIVY